MNGGPSQHNPTPRRSVQTIERCRIQSSTYRCARKEGRRECKKRRWRYEMGHPLGIPPNPKAQRPKEYQKMMDCVGMVSTNRPHFETSNEFKSKTKNSLSVSLEGKGLCPLGISKSEASSSICLLLIGKDKRKHYTWKKGLNCLLNNNSKKNYRMLFCKKCLYRNKQKNLLQQHKVQCQGIGKRAIQSEVLEKRKNILLFKPP